MNATTSSITSSADYLNYWHGIRQAIDQEFGQLARTPAQLKEFFAFVANKRRFLPDDQQDDVTFYKNLLHNQRVNLYLDFKTDLTLLLDRFTVSGDLSFLQQPGPFIFCTFHFGPFPLIGYQLNRLGFTASVLTIDGISNSMIHQDTTDGLDIMHSGSTSVMAEMMNNLESGRSVMAFLDGNLGVTKEIDARSFVPVPLLDDHFYCKKGVPVLSYVTRIPIIPLISYRQGPDQIRMVVDSPIYPDRQLSRDAYAHLVLQRCYALFERQLRQTPEQWEFWNLLGKYMASELNRANHPAPEAVPTQGIRYLFNRQRYDLIQVQTTPFLFDRQSRGYFPITASLAHLLTQSGPQNPTLHTQVSPALLNDLVQRSVVLAA